MTKSLSVCLKNEFTRRHRSHRGAHTRPPEDMRRTVHSDMAGNNQNHNSAKVAHAQKDENKGTKAPQENRDEAHQHKVKSKFKGIHTVHIKSKEVSIK